MLVSANEAVIDTAAVLTRAGVLVTDASGLLGRAQEPLVALLPVLERTAETRPELHALLGLVEDLDEMVARLPGVGRVRCRKDPAAEEPRRTLSSRPADRGAQIPPVARPSRSGPTFGGWTTSGTA